MWEILSIVFSVAIIVLLISLVVLNGRKNNKIFELGKRNILLEYEIEQVLKNRKRLDSMSISKTQDKKMESDNFGVSKGPIK